MAQKAKKPIKKAVNKTMKQVVTKRSENGQRLRKLTKRENKGKLKKQQKSREIPAAWRILDQSLRHLYRNKKLFIGILLTYGVFYILFVKGISANFQLGNLKQNLNETLGGKQGTLNTGFALYGLLLGSAGNGSTDQASVYQMVFLVIFGLALIRGLRVTYGGNVRMRVRDVIYSSTGSLIPFVIVLFFILLQCLPALIASSIYSVAQANGVLTSVPQKGIALAVLFLGLFWTLYMVSSSIFALYIVTLKNPPRASLKAAKELVRYRRSIIIRKVLFLPAALLVISALILVPLIIIYAPAAEIVFMAFTILVLGVVHSYLYTLYRSLI